MWTQRIAASWLGVNNARWQKETARLTKYVRSADIAEFTVACHDYIQNEKLNQGHVRNVSMVTFVLFNHCLWLTNLNLVNKRSQNKVFSTTI